MRAVRLRPESEVTQLTAGAACPKCGGAIAEDKAIEVGNIFQLKTKYAAPFKLEYVDADGTSKPVMMGCYGIGPSRVMGTAVEVHHDDRGIIWPESIAPFRAHLLQLGQGTGPKFLELHGYAFWLRAS